MNAKPNSPPAEAPTVLADEITKRMVRMLLSRRELARRSGLSRQTLLNIEGGHIGLSEATCQALDRELKWVPGTTARLCKGDTSMLHHPSAQIEADRQKVIQMVMDMDQGELATFVLFIESRWQEHRRTVQAAEGL